MKSIKIHETIHYLNFLLLDIQTKIFSYDLSKYDKKMNIKFDTIIYNKLKDFICNSLDESLNFKVLSKQSLNFKTNEPLENIWVTSLFKCKDSLSNNPSIDIALIKDNEHVFSISFFPIEDIIYLSIINEGNFYMRDFSKKIKTLNIELITNLYSKLNIEDNVEPTLIIDSRKEEMKNMVNIDYPYTMEYKTQSSKCIIKVATIKKSLFYYPIDIFIWNILPLYLFIENSGKNIYTNNHKKIRILHYIKRISNFIIY